MNTIIHRVKRSSLFWISAGFVFVVGIGFFDVLTGHELALSLFYVLPLSLVTWFVGKRIGIVISVASVLCWLTVDVIIEYPYSHPAILYWNTIIRFGFFLFMTLMLSAFRNAHEHEKELNRFDYMTGALNARFFSELVQLEIERSQRYKCSFTIAYIDLDNFKFINDNFGHTIGDKVLSTIVKQAKSRLRKVDVIARLGGDEFAFLLPETNQAAAQVAVSKIQISLLEEMRRNNWPVTFSIGVLTCINTPQTPDELIKQVDELMYSVKNNGKNSISYSVYTG